MYGGCDWGAGFKLLALMGEEAPLFSAPGLLAKQDSVALAWHLSRKEWVGLLEGYQRQPARLLLISIKQGKRSAEERVLHSGGRLSAALLKQHEAAISAAFGKVDPLRIGAGITVFVKGM